MGGQSRGVRLVQSGGCAQSDNSGSSAGKQAAAWPQRPLAALGIPARSGHLATAPEPYAEGRRLRWLGLSRYPIPPLPKNSEMAAIWHQAASEQNPLSLYILKGTVDARSYLCAPPPPKRMGASLPAVLPLLPNSGI